MSSGGAGAAKETTADEQRPAADDRALTQKYRKLKSILKQRDAEIDILMNMVEHAKKEGRSVAGSRSRTATTQTRESDYLNITAATRTVTARTSRNTTSSADRTSSRGGRGSSADTVETTGTAHGTRGGGGGGSSVGGRNGATVDREEAFEMFKAVYPQCEWLRTTQLEMKEKFAEARRLGEELDASRKLISKDVNLRYWALDLRAYF